MKGSKFNQAELNRRIKEALNWQPGNSGRDPRAVLDGMLKKPAVGSVAPPQPNGGGPYA